MSGARPLAGLCRLTLQPTSLGYWTIYMSDQDVLGPPGAPEQAGPVRPQGPPRPSPPEVRGDGRGGPRPPEGPQVATITLHKSSNGMGLSIVAARVRGQSSFVPIGRPASGASFVYLGRRLGVSCTLNVRARPKACWKR